MSKKSQVLLLLILAVATVGATIYKWVDEKGVTHYSETPPPKQKAQKIQAPPPPPSTTTEGGKPAPKTWQEKEQEFQKRRAEHQQESSRIEKSSVERAEGEERCLEARKQLAMLQEQLPIYRDEEGKFRVKWRYDTYQGEREYLDDATRTSEIARARQEIGTNCQHPNDAKDQDLARKKLIRSEYCASTRAELEALEQPRARATRQALEEKRQEVEWYCKE